MTENQNLECYHLYFMTICFLLNICPMTRIDTIQHELHASHDLSQDPMQCSKTSYNILQSKSFPNIFHCLSYIIFMAYGKENIMLKGVCAIHSWLLII